MNPQNNVPNCASSPTIWDIVRLYKWTMLVSGVLMVISQAAKLFIPFSTKYLMDTIVLKHEGGRLSWLLAGAFIATVIEAVTFISVVQLLPRVAEKLIADLRRQLQAHITHLPLSYFDKNLTGTLVSRVMSDVEGVRNLIGVGILPICIALLTAVMTCCFLIHKAWSVTLIVVTVQSIAAFAFHRGFTSVRPIVREGNEIRAEVTGRLTESMGGVRVIKSYRAEDREVEVFALGTQRLFENLMQARTRHSVIGLMGIIMFGLTTELVMYFGGKHLIAGSWTTGDYVQYTAMMVYLIGPLNQLIVLGPQMTEALASLDRINEVLSEPIEDADEERATHMPILSGAVRVEKVSFAYEPGKPVLYEIDFESHPGTVTAFVGSSGSGKSTIVSLICAFYKSTAGRILVDGVDLSTVKLASYRNQLGLVLQESFLFDGTIRENILYSRPNATEESFLNACRIACVDEFAGRFPKAYDTIVGERGVKLSGGQRQRLSIARAILADPRILILDEATSSLDSESEAQIQEGLNYLMRGRTTFVIAHRLSTIRRADQILVLEAGHIVERGTHQALYEQRRRYYELYTRQYELEAISLEIDDVLNLASVRSNKPH